MKRQILTYLVALLAFSVVFNNLGGPALNEWDESRNAHNSLGILHTKDVFVMRYLGEPDYWNLKPPLLQWLTALSFILFGINEFSIRFWPALFGVATIITVKIYADMEYGGNTGLYASIILLSTIGFIGYHGASTGDQDSILAFFITSAILLYHKGYVRYSIVSSALAILTKGPAGMVGFLIIGAHMILKRNWDQLKQREILIGTIILIIVLGVWAVPRYMVGDGFFAIAVEKDLVDRVLTPVESHTGEILYYPKAMLDGLGLHLSILAAAAVLYSLKNQLNGDRCHSLPLIWFLAYLMLFTIAQTKIAWYIIPAYPAIALMSGHLIEKVFERLKISKRHALLVFFIFIAPPLYGAIQYNEDSYVEARITCVKGLSNEIHMLDIVYVMEADASQRLTFYLSSYVKDRVVIMRSDEKIKIPRSSGFLTFDKKSINTFDEPKKIIHGEGCYLITG